MYKFLHYARAILNRFPLLETAVFRKYLLFKDISAVEKRVYLDDRHLFDIYLPLNHRGLVDELLVASIREKEYVESFLKFGEFCSENLDFIIDIGSHIGFFVLLENFIFYGKKIIALEPLAANFAILLKNISLCKSTGKYKNEIIPINKAVGNYDGKAKMFVPSKSNWSSLLPVFRNDVDSVDVSITKFDSIIDELKIDIEYHGVMLRMDIEGYEFNFFSENAGIFKESKKLYISAEIHPHLLGNKIFDLIDIWIDIDFKLWKVCDTRPCVYNYYSEFLRRLHNYFYEKLEKDRIKLRNIVSLEQLRDFMRSSNYRFGFHVFMYKEI